MKKIHLRPFTKTDWDCFAGAEKPENSEPMISWDGDTAVVLVDKTGVAVYFDEDEGGESYSLNVTFAAGKVIAESLNVPVDRNELDELGFNIP